MPAGKEQSFLADFAGLGRLATTMGTSVADEKAVPDCKFVPHSILDASEKTGLRIEVRKLAK